MAWAFLNTCSEYSRNIGVQAYRWDSGSCHPRAEQRPCLVPNKDSVTPSLAISLPPASALGSRR